ncbi:MAG: FAD-dependent oxidoreductase [Syntrophomonadaceae bacterium]
MKVVIIGNGAAGNQAAETLRRLSRDVEISIYAGDAEPFYSACALPDFLAGWIPRQQLFLKTPEQYVRQRIELNCSEWVNKIDIDAKEICTNRNIIKYDRLILATGSRPLVPPILGSKLPGNFVVKSPRDIDLLLEMRPSRAVVVGSGNIGVEVAEALQLKGCEATIIEMQPRILPRLFDPFPAGLIQKLLEANGIRVVTGGQVIEVKGKEDVQGVVTGAGFIPCEAVIWGVGAKPNVELAAAAGLQIGALGAIKVDSHMRSSHPDIYACGDCVEVKDILSGRPIQSMLWSSAKIQAQAAAQNIMSQPVEYPGALNLMVEELYGVPCLAAGVREEDLQDGGSVIEINEKGAYGRIILQDGRIAGLQTVGNLDACGTIIAFMKKHTRVDEIKRIVATPYMRDKAPWLLEVERRLGAQ